MKIIIRTFFCLTLIITISLGALANNSSFKGEDQVAFVSVINHNKDIWVINDDGTGLIKLTDNPFPEFSPQWSPDGTKLLYLSSHKGDFIQKKYKLWVVNSDGSNAHILADDLSHNSLNNIDWSPDSNKIIFLSRKGEDDLLTIIDVDGNNRRILTDKDIQADYISFSPNKSEILAYLKGDDEEGLYIIDSKKKEKQKLTDSKGKYIQAQWSADGRKIAYIYKKHLFQIFGQKEGIYIMDSSGKNNIQVVKEDHITKISLDPAGKAILFSVKYEKVTNPEAHITDQNTKTYYRRYIVAAKKNANPQRIKGSLPKWSPDGLKFAHQDGSYVHIKVSGQKGYIKVPVSNLSSIVGWGPNSNKVLCEVKPGLFANNELYVFDYHGNQVYRLVDGGFNVVFSTWSPKN